MPFPSTPLGDELFSQNIDALHALRSVRASGRTVASPDERRRLMEYRGWGQRDARNLAFEWGYSPTRVLVEALDHDRASKSRDLADQQPIYVSCELAVALWRAADRLCGYRFLGRLVACDPCAGSGQIARWRSTGLCASLHALSPDPVDAEVGQLCGVEIRPDEALPEARFDLVVGAAAVGEVQTSDVPRRFRRGAEWALARSVRLLRPGGIAVLALPHSLVDDAGEGSIADSHQNARQWIAERCEVVGLYRLHRDVLVLRRRPRLVKADDLPFVRTPEHLASEADTIEAMLADLPVDVLVTDAPPTRTAPPKYRAKVPVEIAAVVAYKESRAALDLEIAGESFEETLERARRKFETLRAKVGDVANLTGMRGTRELRLLQALQDRPEPLAHRSLRSELPISARDEELFAEPFGSRLIPASEYLTGRVGIKLREARAAGLKRNIEALEAVQPPPLKPEEIRFPMGAPWTSPDVLMEFASHLADVKRSVRIDRVPCGGGWKVEITRTQAEYSTANTITWGVPGMTGLTLLEKILNLRVPEVFKKDPETDKRVLDEDATAQAQGKAEEIREEWRRWLGKHPEHLEKLGAAYNALFRSSVPRTWSGEQAYPGLALTFAGGRPFEPRTHQSEAVGRLASRKSPDDSDLVVHHVGYGKSVTALMGEVRRWQLGLTDRVFVTVPKPVLRQWRAFAADHFPAYADEFMVAPEELSKERDDFLARVAAGEGSFVIWTYEHFASVPISDDALEEWLDRETSDVRDLAAEHPDDEVVQRLLERYERAAEKAREANKKRWDKIRKRELKPFSWDTIVGDRSRVSLVFDEWQYLKKIPVHTKMTRVYGLPKDDSLRAVDALAKVHGVLYAGGHASGLTGTPLTNSLAEAYVAMRFFQPQRLHELGLSTFDDWAATFTEPMISVEMDAVGQFRPVTRLKFVNLPELLALLGEAWSFAKHSIEVERPDLVGGAVRIIEVEGSSDLQDYVEDLAARAELVRARQVHPSVDNMLKITSDGRRASMWNGEPEDVFPLPPKRAPKELRPNRFRGFKKAEQRQLDFRHGGLKRAVKRLFNARVEEMFASGEDQHEEALEKRKRRWTKVDACAREVWKIYWTHHDDQAVQLVFCDLATPKAEADDEMTEAEKFAAEGVYGELRQRLVDHGMLESQIEFIHAHKSEEARVELFRKVNAGIVRVLIGSTDKLGVGTNPQRLVVAVHHLDCPWRPDQLIQRGGRGRRQGNLWTKIHEIAYVTTRSYDVCLWQLIQVKAEFISRLQEGDAARREEDDVGDLVLTAAMAKGLALGDQRVVDKIKLETQLAHLERQRASWINQRAQVMVNAQELPAIIEGYRKDLAATESARDLRKRPERFTVELKTIGGPEVKTITDVEVADSTVYVLGNNLRPAIINRAARIGSYRGKPIQLRMKHGAPALQLVVADDSLIEVMNIHAKGTFSQLDRELGMLDVREAALKKQIEQSERRLADLKAEIETPWHQEEVAKAALTKYNDLCAELTQRGLIDKRSFNL